MESALESSDEARVVALDYPYLRRTQSLEADMVMSIYIYKYMWIIYTYVCVYANMSIHIFDVYMYICIWIYIDIFVYRCALMYTYKHI
jgi:hypothetical protein